MDNALVGADDLAALVQKIPLRIHFFCIGFDKIRVFSVDNETNILAVVLLGVDEIMGLRNCADLRFRHFPKGEHRMRQLLLGHVKQNIALILFQIQRLFQQIPARVFIIANAGIVAGDHIIIVQLLGPLK